MKRTADLVRSALLLLIPAAALAASPGEEGLRLNNEGENIKL